MSEKENKPKVAYGKFKMVKTLALDRQGKEDPNNWYWSLEDEVPKKSQEELEQEWLDCEEKKNVSH